MFSGGTATQGGMFGGGANKPAGTGLFGGGGGGGGTTQQTGMFGGGSQATQQAGGLFGGQGQGGFNQQATGGFGGQQTGGAFGQQAPQQGGGAFGGGQQQGSQGGLFGGQQQQQPQQQQQQGGMFGRTNQQGNGGGLFGGQQQGGQGGGLFGQQPAQGGFGQQQQTQGAFGQNPQQQGTQGGLFGQGGNQQQQGGGGGLFGQAQQGGGGFLGAQGQAGSSFGGQQQQQQGGLFGQAQQQGGQQPQSTGGLFSTFANPNQQQTQQQGQGLFGQGAGGASSFGANTQGAATSTSFGGTTWGVPTGQGQPAQVQAQNVQPVRSKNTKLDHKHMVKCIAALDQFQGLSKEQIRVNFKQTGGQQPAFSQATQPAKTGGAFSSVGQTNLSSFTTSTNLAAPTGGGSTLFGGQTGGYGATTQTQASGSVFGGSPQQTTGGTLFGGSPPQQQSPVFGQTGGSSLFGGQTGGGLGAATQPALGGGTLFGGAQPAATPSFMGGAQTVGGGSLFGGTTQAGSFGSQPAATGSLFGQSPTQPPQGGSLFGGTAPALGNPAGSFFSTQSQGISQNPAVPLFGQMTAPLFNQPAQGAPQGLDHNFLGQMLLAYAAAAGQQQAQTPAPANSTQQTAPSGTNFDILQQMMTNFAQNKPTQSNKLLSDTPFDEFMNEARKERWEGKNKQAEASFSLFSDYERESLNKYELPSIYMPEDKAPEEIYRIKTVKQSKNTQEPLFSEVSAQKISKKIRNIHEDQKKKAIPTAEELPKIGDFKISPSLDRLRGYTHEQLKRVERFRVWNEFGEVEFLDPVSVLGLDLRVGVSIGQDNIEVNDGELEEKRMMMTFRDFGGYSGLKHDDRDKLVRKMRRWVQKYEMRQIRHDKDTGDLVVEVGE